MALFEGATGGLFGLGGSTSGGMGGQAAGYATPDQIRLAYIDALKRRASGTQENQPIRHWTQGVADVLDRTLAAREIGNINQLQQQQAKEGAESLVPSLGSGALASLPMQGDASGVMSDSGPIPGASMAGGMSPAPAGGVLAPDYIARTSQIESGGNPNAVTGSNRGLMQFGPQEERQFGINDSNRTDPNAQAAALTKEAALHTKVFEKQLGRTPTPGELYLMHQQGIAGAPALLKNPDAPAWQAVRPYYKSDAMAKSAISGNTYKDAPFFGSDPNSVRAGDFANYWKTKFERGLASAGGKTASLGTSATDAIPGMNAFAPATDQGELSPVKATLNALGGGAVPPMPQAPPMVEPMRVAEGGNATQSDARPLKGVPQVNYAQTQQGRFVPDSMFPVRPKISEQEARAVQMNPAVSPQAKAAHLQQYYAQAQPQEVKTAGGTVSRDPRSGVQTWNPDLKTSVRKVAGMEVTEAWTIGPDGKKHVVQTENATPTAPAAVAAAPQGAASVAMGMGGGGNATMPPAAAAPAGAPTLPPGPAAQAPGAVSPAAAVAGPMAASAPMDLSTDEGMAAAAIEMERRKAAAEAAGKQQVTTAQEGVERARAGQQLTGGLERLSGFPEEFGTTAMERAIGPLSATGTAEEKSGFMGTGLSVNTIPQMAARVYGELQSYAFGGAKPTEVRDRIDTTTKNLAAVMKPLIRKPGEGAWSDKDQENLEAQLGQVSRSRSVEEYNRRLNDVRENISKVFQVPVAEPKAQARSPLAPKTAEQEETWIERAMTPPGWAKDAWRQFLAERESQKNEIRQQTPPTASFAERFLTPPQPQLSTQEAFIRALRARGGS